MILLVQHIAKTSAESLCTRRRAQDRAGREAKTPYRIVLKFCTGVDVPDIITHAKFCGHRFRGFGDSEGSNLSVFHWFPLTFVVVRKTLWHYCASVWLIVYAVHFFDRISIWQICLREGRKSWWTQHFLVFAAFTIFDFALCLEMWRVCVQYTRPQLN